ncbi:hypothetical protein N7445_003559 [Penicillium cf. griseofulvum]|nr:hypothetical protein N7445_003559 [Penicillium cf. griseofulvum]
MKFFNVILVAGLAAFVNAAAVPNPEAALTNPLEKRCKSLASEVIYFLTKAFTLPGWSNWRAWEKQMLRMLGFNNNIYVQLINNELGMLPPPIYEDTSHASVKAQLFKEVEGNKEMERRITEEVIEARCAEIVTANLELRKRYADGEEKPEASALVSGHLTVHDAYLELMVEYWDQSHYGSYLWFEKLLNLRYTNVDPHTFVVHFKKLLGNYTEVVGKMTPIQEFCHFKRATIDNDLCYSMFLVDLDLEIDEDPDLDQIYSEFIRVMSENLNPWFSFLG